MWFLVFCLGFGIAVSEELKVSTPGSLTVSRVVGGTETTIEQYPYVVQILYSSQLICAGSSLTRRHVMSAGHCFVNDFGTVQRPTLYSIRAATSYLNTGGTVHGVSTIIVHESYNQPERDNDIAVLVLTSSLTYSTSIQPANIPPQGYNLPDNMPVVHVGWGRTNANVAALSSTLQHVTVLSVNRDVCRQRYQWLQNQTGENYPVTQSMICAGLLDIGGADACQGDSGGPLVYGGVVVGLTSWGLGCGEPAFPGVNANVASYTNWINATVTAYSTGSPMKKSNYLVMFISILATTPLFYSK